MEGKSRSKIINEGCHFCPEDNCQLQIWSTMGEIKSPGAIQGEESL